ncbi:hypothetical protein QTP70_031726 [Hemibagrus guttatus]|uniref:Uncharacterized protein n=1 Tax=Hemibagrus guttatus TaxID=175788 RepID=A0AAE0QS54_9TELE|nr:hypothetical protein QTP70_031726 [Hemibagrus guttatus]
MRIDIHVNMEGDTVASMLASHLQGWGFDSRPRHVCVEFACSARASGVSPGYSSFLPQSKDMHCRLIGISKLSVVCVCPAMGWTDMSQPPLPSALEPPGLCSEPLLYSLYTYDCVATTNSSTTVTPPSSSFLMTQLWSDLSLTTMRWPNWRRLGIWRTGARGATSSVNVSKTKELIMDFSTEQERNYQTPVINESPVERVDSFRYLGVHAGPVMVLSHQQPLYHFRHLRDFRLPSKVLRNFYFCTIESILTGNIATWFGNSSMQDRSQTVM